MISKKFINGLRAANCRERTKKGNPKKGKEKKTHRPY
jgi:hypothetical protein